MGMDVIKVKDREELQKILDDDESYEAEYEEFHIQNEYIGDDMIFTCGRPYYIENLGLLVIEGEYCNNDDGEFIPDWSLTLVYKWDSEDTTFDQEDALDYDYFEQDPPNTTLHNYLYMLSQQTNTEKEP